MRRLLPLLLASCAGIAPPAYAPLDRKPTAEETRTRPHAATEGIRERWLLRRGSTEIVFTLLVEFDPDLQFVALDDFGGVLADGSGGHSHALPAAVAERIGQVLRAKYAPRNPRLVQVGSVTGWQEPDVLWVGDEMYTRGMRVRSTGVRRYEVDGALTATVTIG